jgi:hypothetical protein
VLFLSGQWRDTVGPTQEAIGYRVARVTNDTWVRHGSVVTGSYLRGGATPSTTLMGGHFYLWVFLGVMSVVFTVVEG